MERGWFAFVFAVSCSWIVWCVALLGEGDLFSAAGLFADEGSRARDTGAVLRRQLEKMEVGEYVVTEQAHAYVLLFVYAKGEGEITLEEITVPTSRFSANKRWQDWLKQGAKGNTSWVRYRIDLVRGAMVDYYSFTHRGWCSLSGVQSLLATLLRLEFTLVPPQERRRVGPPPQDHMPDYRPLWQPRWIVGGVEIPGATFDVWRTRWPSDGSALSGRKVEVYLLATLPPSASSIVSTHFPQWMEVEGMVGKVHLLVVDSGSGVESPQPPLVPPLGLP